MMSKFSVLTNHSIAMIKQVINSLFVLGLLLTVSPVFAQSKAARQKEANDKLLTEYFALHNIQPTKTRSGLYYMISKPGTGKNAWRGQTVTVNYTGRLLDGTTFDSNLDTTFGHTQPLSFEVGMGRVIKGWDEGVQLMNAGSKATFYVPSGLAYGEKSVGTAIPSNSILIFDVTLLSIDK